MRLGEPVEKRKEGMDGRLVGADDDTPAADLLELADRDLGICGEAQQPRRVLLQQPSASVGAPLRTERSNSRSPSSSSRRRIARLTAGWVRWSFFAATEKLRSAATVTNVPKSCSCTKWIIIWSYLNQTSINWTAGWARLQT